MIVRPSNMSRRGFLRGALGLTTAMILPLPPVVRRMAPWLYPDHIEWITVDERDRRLASARAAANRLFGFMQETFNDLAVMDDDEALTCVARNLLIQPILHERTPHPTDPRAPWLDIVPGTWNGVNA